MDRRNIINIHECKLSKDGTLVPPIDDYSKRVLDNILASCEELYDAEIRAQVPQKPDSPFPHHNLYLAFYTGAECGAMLTEYSFAYAITKQKRYSDKARQWFAAMSNWDASVFSFYAGGRMMYEIVASLYWLQDEMSDGEIEDVYGFLRRLCLHLEDEAYRTCHSSGASGHDNVYTAGFGIAALALREAGIEPKAELWLAWVLSKYENALLHHDGSPDGTYLPDGNWAIEYVMRHKLLFLDAYRLVTGEDLIAKHRDAVTKQVPYLRCAYMGDGKVPGGNRRTNDNMLEDYQINASGPVYLRLASITGDPYLQWIGMTNPEAGKVYRSGIKVKGGSEFMMSIGPLGYLWYDPSVKPAFCPPEETSTYYPDGNLAIMRTRFGGGLTAAYRGRRGTITHQSPNLLINKNGRAMICGAPEKNSLPMEESCCPSSGGGDMERKGSIKSLVCGDTQDILEVEGFLTRQRITVSHGGEETVSVCLEGRNRSERECSLHTDEQGGYVSLRDEGYLQYKREKNFNDSEGTLEMEFRLSKQPSNRTSEMLFSTGQHMLYSYGNAMFVGFLEGGRLGVRFKDSEGRWLFAQLSNTYPIIQPGVWYRVRVSWKHLNQPGKDPVCSIELDGYRSEASVRMPNGKPFSCRSNTSLWVGGMVQMQESFAQADIRSLKIYGTRRQGLLFEADYSRGLDAVYAKGRKEELAQTGLEYRLHVVRDADSDAVLEHGAVRLRRENETLWIVPEGAGAVFTIEDMPYARTGFAGESFEAGDVPNYRRIRIKPKGKERVLQFAFKERR